MVKLLIDHGADLNTKDRRGFSPLGWAVIEEHFEIVQYLIKLGVNINDEFESPLSIALNKGYFKIAKLLLKHGANVQFQRNILGLLQSQLRITFQSGFSAIYDNDNQRDIIQELKREHLEMVCLIHIIQHLQNHNTVNSIEYNNFESLNSELKTYQFDHKDEINTFIANRENNILKKSNH